MTVIGIDPSLTGTAICSWDSGVIKRSLHITPPSKQCEGFDRVVHIVNSLSQYINDTKEITCIAKEGYSYSSKGAVYQIGELGGCINMLIKRVLPDVPFYVFSPKTVKKFCLGNGNIKKDSAYLLKVYDQFDIRFDTDDDADAFMIAYMAEHVHHILKTNDITGITDKEKEALLSNKLLKKDKLTINKAMKLDPEEFIKYIER